MTVIDERRRQLCDPLREICCRDAHEGQPAFRRHDHGANFEVELLGKFEVPLIVPGNAHDRASPVTDQHIVCNPDRDALSGRGIDCVPAGEDAAFFAAARDPILFAHRCYAPAIFLHLVPAVRSGKAFDQWMFRGEDHVGGPEERVRPGGVYPD